MAGNIAPKMKSGKLANFCDQLKVMTDTINKKKYIDVSSAVTWAASCTLKARLAFLVGNKSYTKIYI